ncbi:unnamed protein product [Candida verbasci]|uniref:Uncharacterized protein n=1 Tax=Candida verbasci TaxID=1227364 RepID=A0A9W4TUP0_9ASCO|nr:unnamed protein product [Candida verbasci]
MFKQKYNKRKTRTLKRRASLKTEIKRETKREDYIESLSKISNDDFGTNSESYNWLQLTPRLKPKRRYKFAKLKQLCAQELALNADLIDSKILSYIPHDIYKYIWKFILLLEQDSILSYSIFSKLSVPTHSNTNSLKDSVISLYKIPNRHHRIENLFKNLNLKDLVNFLQTFKPYLIFDASRIDNFQYREDYFMLFNLPKLICLNLSGHSFVDDIYINNLCSSIKDGKLPKLTVIKLNNTKITNSGLISLFKSCAYSSLSCIETSLSMETDEYQWSKIEKDQQGTILQKSPLGLKLNRLIKQKSIELDISNINLLDIMIVDDEFTQRDGQIAIESAWKARQKARVVITGGETYLINRDEKIKTTEYPELKLEEKPVQSRKRKKLIKTNAATFFN